MRLLNRHETDTAITYTFAEDNDPGQQVVVIQKSDPLSMSVTYSAATATQTWQQVVAAYDASQVWVTI